MTPTVPLYSATLYDPRGKPAWDAGYWVDNLRHTVRFAAAVQAALEDGHRVFAELAPHPLLTHAVEQTARSLDVPLAALASMRRELALPHGLRGFLADLYSAGAAVDFSVLYPGGRLVDAPLPTWTHRRLLLTRDGQESHTHGACTVSVHPLLGPHVRLQEEPERHVWQAEVGTAAQPWLGDHQILNVAALPGAAYCEMALAAARAILGERSEVRDIRFEQALLLDDQTPVGAVASVASPGVANFVVETNHEGEHVRRATAVLHAADDDEPPAHDISALLAAHPRREEGTDIRKRMDKRGVQLGPAFTGLVAARTAEGTISTVLAEIGLPGPLRSQQPAYGVHPALLDACFQSVEAHPDVQALGAGILLVPLGIRRLRAYGTTRNAHYCYTRVTRADAAGVEADLDVLDEHGTVLLTVHGLRFGTGVSDSGHSDRVLNERLLTIEWQQRAVPDVAHADAGNMAADQHLRRCGSTGNQADRCAETPWRAMHDHVLATSRRPSGLSPNGWAECCAPADSPVWSSSPRHQTATRRSNARSGAGVCTAPGAHRPRASRHPRRAAPPVRRDQESPDVCCPTTWPTWSRPGCVA